MKTLEGALKFIGAIPIEPRPKETLTKFQQELDKIKYKIGAIPYKPGREYLREPVQWDIIMQTIYGKLGF